MLRAKEANLLTRDQLERMLSEPSFADACRMAADAGYQDMSEMDVAGVNAALEQRRVEELTDIREMLPDKAVAVLVCLQYDCHNAKVLVKSGGDLAGNEALLSRAGCFTPEQLKEVYDAESGAGDLPVEFAEAIRAAKQALARTGNPQLSDFLLDKAYFAEMLSLAERTGRPFLVDFVRNRIDKVNLRSLLRTLDMGKRSELLSSALIEGGGIGIEQLAEMASTKEDAARLYNVTIFDRAAEAGDMTGFEKAADNAELEFTGGGCVIPFGPEVVVEYASALENEIVSLRIILTGKRMGIGAETLRERLRETYV